MTSYTEMFRQSQNKQLALLRQQVSDQPAHAEFLEHLMAGSVRAVSTEDVADGAARAALTVDVRWIRQIGAAGFAALFPGAYLGHRSAKALHDRNQIVSI